MSERSRPPLSERLKRSWAELRADPPGERFQRRYGRRHQEADSPWRRWAMIAAGVAVLLAGLFFLPAPGPGAVVVALGAALLAQELRPVARGLDWLEVKVRRLLGRDPR